MQIADQDKSMTRKDQLKSPIRVDLTSDQDTVASSKAVLIEVFDHQISKKKPGLNSG